MRPNDKWLAYLIFSKILFMRSFGHLLLSFMAETRTPLHIGDRKATLNVYQYPYLRCLASECVYEISYEYGMDHVENPGKFTSKSNTQINACEY